MKSLHLLVLSSILFFSACDEHQQTTCVESDYYKIQGDSCIIMEGDTAKSYRIYTSITFNKVLKDLECCKDQVYGLILHKSKISKNDFKQLSKFSNLRHLTLSDFDIIPEEIGNIKTLESLSIMNDGEVSLPQSVKNLSRLKALTLSCNNFPEQIFEIPRLTSLEITSIDHEEYLPKHLSKIKTLERLHITAASLVPQQIFELENLRYLYIHTFRKSTSTRALILPSSLENLQNLQTLSLRGSLDSIPSSIIGLSKLQHLTLPALKTIPRFLDKLSHITSLNITRNQKYPSQNLENILSKFTHLTKLELHQSGSFDVAQLGKAFAQLKKLDSLIIRGNFTTFPTELKQLAQLSYLDFVNFPGSNMKAFPPEILYLKNLQSLSMEQTQITSLPPEISQLTKLRYLNLSNQKLKSIPDEISKLSNLETLMVNGNQLQSIPDNLANIKTLRFFLFNNNQIGYEQTQSIKLRFSAVKFKF